MNTASMILRILAILGAVAAAVMFYIIGDTKDQLETELQSTQGRLNQTENQLNTVRGEREELQTEVTNLNENLEESRARAASLDTQLTQVRQELADANRAITAQERETESLRADAAQIRRQLLDERNRIAELETSLEDSDDAAALRASVQELERQLLETERQLQSAGGAPDGAVVAERRDEARSTLIRGEVVEVGPDSNYILINRGSSEGVRQNSSVMIRRGPRYIARASITEVHDDLSVAEVVSGSDRIRTGDLATTLN